MDRGIWAIWYEIADDNQSEYLDWFHSVHIPEKLSRPGYVWAAHYTLIPAAQTTSYLALFAATTAYTFLNPSPGQLLQRQSPQTKRMMAMRQQPAASIFSEEVRIDGPDAGKRGSAMTAGPVIQMGNYNAANPAVEDDLGAWYAQERLPLLASLPGCVGARKMLATVGAFKHAILHEFTSLELRERHFGPHEGEARDPNTWMGRVRPQLRHAPRSPAVGQRIWPRLA